MPVSGTPPSAAAGTVAKRPSAKTKIQYNLLQHIRFLLLLTQRLPLIHYVLKYVTLFLVIHSNKARTLLLPAVPYGDQP